MDFALMQFAKSGAAVTGIDLFNAINLAKKYFESRHMNAHPSVGNAEILNF
jgi:hypothetical protein